MGKLALLLVLSVGGITVYHSASSGQSMASAADQAAEGQRRVLARAAAKTGWQRAKQELVGGFAAGTITGQNGPASYTVTTTLAGDEAIVVSQGRMPIPGKSAQTTYTLTFRLRALGRDLPEFASQALIVDGDLTTGGSGSIVTSGTGDDSVPVRVHANGNLHSSSYATRIEGFGTYTTSSSGSLTNTFQPRSNPDGDPVIAQRDSIQVPTVVPSEILAAHGGADVAYPHNTNRVTTVLNGLVLPGGTRDDPMVYYSPGSASLSNVTFTGYVVFVAEGKVDLGGTVQGTPSHPDGQPESALGVFTSGAVTMNGNANAYAAIHSNGGMTFRGDVDIYGNLIVANDFSNGGGATIHYIPPALRLFYAWVGDPALEVLAFREQ